MLKCDQHQQANGKRVEGEKVKRKEEGWQRDINRNKCFLTPVKRTAKIPPNGL